MYWKETIHEGREWDGVVSVLDSAAADAANLIYFLRSELDIFRERVEELEDANQELTNELTALRNKYE